MRALGLRPGQNDALYGLLDSVAEVREDHNPRLEVAGIVVNQFQPRARLPKRMVDGLIEGQAVDQMCTFEAGLTFARTEGIVPAPEPTHALAATIAEATRCAESGEEKVILPTITNKWPRRLSAGRRLMACSMGANRFELPPPLWRRSMTRRSTGLLSMKPKVPWTSCAKVICPRSTHWLYLK